MKIAPANSAITTASAEVSTVTAEDRQTRELDRDASALAMRGAPSHQQSQLRAVNPVARKFTNDLTVVNHQNTIAQVKCFIQVERNPQHPPALISLGHNLGMHK